MVGTVLGHMLTASALVQILLCGPGKVHWELLLRARAVETQCFVIAAAQAGQHNAKRESYGHSIVIDPWGEVIAKLDDPQATGGACVCVCVCVSSCIQRQV